MFVRRLWVFVVLTAFGCGAQELTIAAASDLQFALPEIVSAFEQQHPGQKVRVVFGSSGNFLAQIQNDAPFDVFLSADVEYPRRLEDAGLTKKDSLYVYGVGRIVVLAARPRMVDVKREGLPALARRGFKRIAIANPSHAPYGRAAKAALQKAGVWDAVKDKIVTGENISQAVHFVRSGNAEAGIVALSMVLSPRMGIEYEHWVVPQELYPELQQAAVILKASKHTKSADEFVAFLKSDTGQKILKTFGFVPPQPKQEIGKP
ncbi:MAG TPA: molybdate ABC transporter substrate-binding protein [Terriglobales bacterium]|nr:molybdate ABC transporter substrate-binding protein [Terriglobales bacterium]